MNCLDLFSGTHSFANCCKEIGYNCITLDRDLEADIKIDIMKWDYKSLDPNSFDIIWASPPCVAYSRLRDCNLGKRLKNGIILTKEILEKDMKESDKVVKRVLEIFDYFKPHWWFMENPQTARLKDRDVVKGLPFYDVDYCKYSDWGYKKRTRIWTNREGFMAKLCNKDCENMIKKRNELRKHKKVCDGGYDKRKKKHKKIAIGGSTKVDGGWVNKGTSKLERYRVPSELIFSLLLD